MIRLAWRQLRTEAIVGAGLLVAVAIVLGVTGPQLVDVYRASPNQVMMTDKGLRIFLSALLLAAPALTGVFLGAPLVARELEAGSYRLAWTQSVTRQRWLTAKLGLVGLAASALAGGLSLMVAWWASPITAVSQSRFSLAQFGMFGIVPFGYATFAFALGAATGVLLRRTLPAMAATIVGYVGVRLAVTYWIRPHFEPPLTRSLKLRPGGFSGLVMTPRGLMMVPPEAHVPNGWVLSTSLVDKAGHAPASAFLRSACPGIAALAGQHAVSAHPRHVSPGRAAATITRVGELARHCVAAVGSRFHSLVVYQPANRYWPFQAYETALFVVLAAALCGVALWWLRRRLA